MAIVSGGGLHSLGDTARRIDQHHGPFSPPNFEHRRWWALISRRSYPHMSTPHQHHPQRSPQSVLTLVCITLWMNANRSGSGSSRWLRQGRLELGMLWINSTLYGPTTTKYGRCSSRWLRRGRVKLLGVLCVNLPGDSRTQDDHMRHVLCFNSPSCGPTTTVRVGYSVQL